MKGEMEEGLSRVGVGGSNEKRERWRMRVRWMVRVMVRVMVMVMVRVMMRVMVRWRVRVMKFGVMGMVGE